MARELLVGFKPKLLEKNREREREREEE